MNESLAKQLHDLINTAKLNAEDTLSREMNNLEKQVNKLIEKQNTQENKI